MSGGHFKSRWKKFFLRKIQGGGKVEFEEKVSTYNSTTSKDPFLIAKSDEPKIEGQFHSSDRNVKSIQIQTGAGKSDKKQIQKIGTPEESDSNSTDTESSISLDFDQQDSTIENSSESRKRKEVEVDSSALSVQEKESPRKKFKTYDFNLID